MTSVIQPAGSVNITSDPNRTIDPEYQQNISGQMAVNTTANMQISKNDSLNNAAIVAQDGTTDNNIFGEIDGQQQISVNMGG